MKKLITSYLFILLCTQLVNGSTWPQWRGENRNGQTNSTVKLSEMWDQSGPKLLWESEEIPSQDYGGFGSVIANSEMAFISLVWHKDIPTETRKISDLVLRKLGARKINLPPELVQLAEKDRLALSPRLRGSKLDLWIEKWIEKNLNQKQKLTTADLIASRFRKGKLALPVSVIDELFDVKNRVFENQQKLDNWLSQKGFSKKIQEKISQAVPPTMQVAEDAVLALDLKTGVILWKTSLESVPSGRKSSSTPCLSEQKIFAIGSEQIYCLDAETGKPIWNQPLDTKEIASSILPFESMVIVLAGNLLAFDKETGQLLWKNIDVSGKAASPIIWKTKGKNLIICNSTKSVIAVDPKDGKTIWEGDGGGSSTPVCSSDYLVVHGKKEDVGLTAYHSNGESIVQSWRIPKLTRRTDSSPIIFNGHAYLIGSGMRLCINLKTGKVVRKIIAKHDISSPILADGKILAYEINGNFLTMIDPNPNNFEEIQKTKITALRCTSPCLVGSKLIIRKEKRIACYELGETITP